MNELAINEKQLPDNIGELSKFILVGREKLKAVRAEISAIEKVGLAKEVYEQKKAEAQEIAELVTLSEVKIGRMIKDIPKATPNNNPFHEIPTGGKLVKPKSEVLNELGIKKNTASHLQQMAEHEDIVKQAIAEAKENDDIISRSAVLKKIKSAEKEKEIESAKEHIAEQSKNETVNKPILHIGDGIGYKPSEKYDLLLTDPPYSTDVDDIEKFVDNWLYNALDNVKDTGFAYVFIGAYPDEMKAYLNAKTPGHIRLEQNLIWAYKNTLGNNPKNRYKQNYQVCLFYRGINAPVLDCPLTSEQWAVQEINAPDGRIGDRYHAWQKPMEIAERFIRHSTKKGMLVFDPFACTGTFILAAAKLGRKGIGFEINPDNAKIAFNRGCVDGKTL